MTIYPPCAFCIRSVIQPSQFRVGGKQMPRPSSLWAQVNMPLDFRFRGWEDVIGNKCCFHLVGFKELALALGFDRLMDLQHGQGKIPTKDLVDAVPRAVPAKWRDEFKLA